jgi:hypothetical protein
MVQKMGRQFGGILGWGILEDVLKKVAEVERMNFVILLLSPEKG